MVGAGSGKGGHVRQGFTLVELLLGTVIFSVVALTVYAVLFSALKIQQKSARYEDTVGQVSLALEIMARDLENTVGYNFANSYPAIKAFSGVKGRLTFLQPAPEGLLFITYELVRPDEGRRETVRIGQHQKKNTAVTQSVTAEAPVYQLVRKSQPWIDFVNQSTDNIQTRIVARNIAEDGMKCSFGSVNPDSGERVWYSEWSFNVIPALTRIDLTAAGAQSGGQTVSLRKEVLNPAGTMIVD